MEVERWKHSRASWAELPSTNPLSGSPTPCSSYVDKPVAKAGTQLKFVVRGKSYDAEVTKMPFVPNNYYRLPA